MVNPILTIIYFIALLAALSKEFFENYSLAGNSEVPVTLA
jgi:hypothetical protein